MKIVKHKDMTIIFTTMVPCEHDIAEIYNLIMFQKQLREKREKERKGELPSCLNHRKNAFPFHSQRLGRG